MARRVWIEVAVNGAQSRAQQPDIPVNAQEIIEEGIACVRAGAAVVHAHTLDPVTGAQDDDAENCATFIRGIKAGADAIVYPTASRAGTFADFAEKYRGNIALARRGLLEWGVLDPGSVNLHVPGKGPGGIHLNSVESIEYRMKLAAECGFHPTYACYEPGFVRLGAAAHARNPSTPQPVYRFMFSTAFTFGFPPEPWALDAMVKLIETVSPGAPWMIAGLGVDVTPLVAQAVALGGHVRVGLEDLPQGTRRRNVELVEAAVEAVQKAGGEPATATEIRAALGSPKARG